MLRPLMERTKIGDLAGKVGQSVSVSAWVDVRRDQGKMVFLVLRDASGSVQSVVLPDQPESIEVAHRLRPEWVVKVAGEVVARPPKNVKEREANGAIELSVKGIEVLAEAKELPFDLEAELNIDTLFDNRPLTLRRRQEQAIFKVQATAVQAYRDALVRRGFTEFQAPALVGGDAEGGAAVFRVDYFGREANLATSPQLYKQIMVGAFERAFTIAKVFRAEKSATTRHLSEITQMDFEMGFIDDERDVMAVLEAVVRDACAAVAAAHPDAFALFGAEAPALPEKPFPAFTLAEAQEIIAREFGRDPRGEPDMAPEDERQICEWAKREHGSDFVFITRFPTAVRAFYTYEDPAEAPASRGFDLLFRGLEINSGSQRIHRYEDLVARIEARGMNPEKFSFYLQAFKYGMPPHGGCSTGLERFTARMLNLPNVKEASAFPRDLNRIDLSLAKSEGDAA